MDHVLVTGAGGFIGGHLVRRLREDGVGRIRAVDCKPKDEWYQVFDDVENVAHRPPAARGLPRRHRGRRHGVQPGGRHGRHGLHREQQGPVHAVGARVDPRARGRPRVRGRAPVLLVVGVRLRGREAALARGGAAARVRRLPRHARGRVRLGEAVQRADGPPLPRGLRHRDPRGPLSQRVRARGHVGGRPREGPRRHLPQGGGRRADRRPLDRDLGRRRADPQLHLHRRLPRGHAAARRPATWPSR